MDFENLVNFLHKLLEVERFLNVSVNARFKKFVNPVLFYHSRDGNHADPFGLRVGLEHSKNLPPVDVGEHNVEENQVRLELTRGSTCGETARSGPEFKFLIL